jgi:hypothetical protein
MHSFSGSICRNSCAGAFKNIDFVFFVNVIELLQAKFLPAQRYATAQAFRLAGLKVP